ncbi:protein kinase [Sorangium sp. So ce429]
MPGRVMDHDHRSRSSPEISSGDPGRTFDLALERPAPAGATAPPALGARAREPAPLAAAPAPPAEPVADWVLPDAGAALKHYEIIRKLGQGGMGTVFLARDTKLGRLVAIKLLLEYSGQQASRFLAEARVTARCRHENIVVIHEVDEVHGHPYMVLEYIKGRTLREWVAQRERRSGPEQSVADDAPPGPVSASLAVELMIPVARALACAHELGIVHRDLKPENILLDDAGSIKVVDFGIAKQLEARVTATITSAQEALTRDAVQPEDSTITGTLPYMSPEQLRGRDIDYRADIWAMGIVLYELVTGAHPLDPFSPASLLDLADLDAPMPSASARRKDAGALGAVIDRCLKKRKAERIGSAKELLAELEALLPGRNPLSLGEDESPFAGLSSFQEADAARFFGRDRDIAAMTAWLRNQRLVAIAGPSGVGKSSFVRAGVIPALKRSGDRWDAFILRPGRRPLSALVDVLAQADEPDAAGAGVGSAAHAGRDELVATLRSEPGHLGARLRARCRREGGRRRVLLFVDQFEELYTLGAAPEERAAFIACLEGAADDASSPVRVALAIRSDFLDRMAEDRHFMAGVTGGLWFLPPMGREGLREALTRPLVATGYRFETEEMIEHMLGALESARGPLPLLQFTAEKLWEARDRELRLLTRRSYEQLGGLAGALSAHADAVLSGMTPREQRLARPVLVRLVTPERTRAVVSLDELCELSLDGEGSAAGEVAQVIQRLAGARLLLLEAGGERGDTTAELVHESLIEQWAKLRRWLDDSEQDAQFLAQVRAAAQQWETSGQAEGLLWRDRVAQDARAWLDRRRAEQGAAFRVGLGNREERYLLAVVALAERARRLRRRLVTGGIVTLGMAALVVSYLAIRAGQQASRAELQAARADRHAARAQAEALQARNATRMATARELQADPTTVLALLREVEPPDVPRGWAGLARWSLHRPVARSVLIHPDGVLHAGYSPIGERIVTASYDRTARVWNADGTGEPLVLRGHMDALSWAAFSPDGRRIVTASYDRTARVWNADGAGEPLVLRGHDDRVYSAAFSPDGRRIVTASHDRTARVWNADGTGEPLVLRGHANALLSAAFSPDGRRIVTASQDSTARVWSADGTGEPLVLRGHTDALLSAAFSPDGRRIVTASQDKTARVWSAHGMAEPVVLRGHEEGVAAATFSPDGRRVVTASQDKTARVWSAHGASEPLVLRGHQDAVASAAFSPDGERIVTASFDRTTRVWDTDGAPDPLLLRGHENSVCSAEFSPDGKRIVTASFDRTTRVWNADGSGEPLVLRGHEDRVFSAEFSPDGKRIVTASFDRTTRVWNADGSGEPLILRGHEDRTSSARFSPDGRRIVTASYDGTARVWNADGSGEPLVLRGHTNRVYSAEFSPDGTRIVTTSYDGTARVWNADGSGEPLVLRGHTNRVYSAEFSPDGTRIVTTSYDGTARVWNADGSGEPLVLHGHEHWVLKAAFSPDGKRIVTASQDRTARIWSADGTGEPTMLKDSDYPINYAAFSPDGKRIVTASDDSGVRVWTDLDPLRGIDDPKLWTATTYCMSVERRIELLRVTEDTARLSLEACLRRVAEAHAAAAGSSPDAAAGTLGAASDPDF